MTDTQILTLAIAIVVPLALLLLSNSRFTDVKEALRAEMKAQHVEVMGEVKAINAFLREVLMPKLDEMDTRLTALEGKK